MLITLLSDIAFDPTGLCAYAVQAKADGPTMRKTAMFKRPMKNAHVAEVCGVVNGLSALLNHFSPPAGSRILVQHHSPAAIEVLQGANRDPIFNEVLMVRTRLLAGTALDIRYVHTKGVAGRRKAGDDWCHTMCRQTLREYLKDDKKSAIP